MHFLLNLGKNMKKITRGKPCISIELRQKYRQKHENITRGSLAFLLNLSKNMKKSQGVSLAFLLNLDKNKKKITRGKPCISIELWKKYEKKHKG